MIINLWWIAINNDIIKKYSGNDINEIIFKGRSQDFSKGGHTLYILYPYGAHFSHAVCEKFK